MDVTAQEPDEIQKYENFRYIGSSEACWRLFEFPIQQRNPAVECLPIHLPGEHHVIFDPKNPELALQRAETTKLTAYFRTNDEVPEARSILYCDFPQHFTWQKNRWQRRVRKTRGTPETIGRIYSVHPSQGETFYLRLLLHHQTGATSFETLRTINGRLCETFKEACLALNLLEDDNEWFICLAEAVKIQSPSSMRSLFITILLFCQPAEPMRLFETHKYDLAEDFHFRRSKQGYSNETLEAAAVNDLLCDLDGLLEQHGRKTTDFGLPASDRNLQNRLDFSYDEIDPQAEVLFTERFTQLNSDQKAVFEYIRKKIDDAEGGMIFIDAPGGTGKTFLLNLILAYVRKQNRIAVATASSGIAATLLKLGRTAHSRFKLPIPPMEHSLCGISPRDATGRLLHDASILVWDEAPMSHKYLIDALDRTLRDIMSNDHLLGGKLLILAGDFRQILPVVRRGRRPAIVEASMKHLHLWRHCITLNRRINMRVLNRLNDVDASNRECLQHYAEWLLQLGEGKIQHVPDMPYCDVIELPKEVCVDSEDDVVRHAYHDLHIHYKDPEWLAARGILATKNTTVDILNDKIMEELPGETITLRSVDSVADDNNATLYSPEFLNSLNISGLPPHKMNLKNGAPIMLLRNLDPQNGHCNGTRYFLKSVTDRLLEACMLGGERAGSILLIPRIVLMPSDTDLPFTLRRRQFPIRPAFSMTINKSQGQTFQQCGVLLSESVFTHGQLYVALSRVGNPRDLRIFANQAEFQSRREKRQTAENTTRYMTRNVVYPEIV